MKPQTTLVDSRVIILGIFVILVGGLGFWRPWLSTPAKTIDVTGEGIVKALPDEYVFSPTYQEGGDTSLQATEKVTVKGNEVVAKLKELGVSSDDISTSVSAYQNYNPGSINGTYIGTFVISASVPDQVLAEKVTTYVATTGATNTVTPQASFKEETKTKLELEARQKALDQAKLKAEQTASAMGVRLGKVFRIYDTSGYPQPYPLPYAYTEGDKGSAVDTSSSSPISSDTTLQTGKQEIRFSVSVTYRYY